MIAPNRFQTKQERIDFLESKLWDTQRTIKFLQNETDDYIRVNKLGKIHHNSAMNQHTVLTNPDVQISTSNLRMNLPALAADIVRRVHHSQDSAINLETVVLNLIREEIEADETEDALRQCGHLGDDPIGD